jgi:hypothetical protein
VNGNDHWLLLRVLIICPRTAIRREKISDVLGCHVNRWTDDMARWLVIQLLNALSKVGLDYADVTRLEKGPQLTLFGEH